MVASDFQRSDIEPFIGNCTRHGLRLSELRWIRPGRDESGKKWCQSGLKPDDSKWPEMRFGMPALQIAKCDGRIRRVSS
jgi:hypothetical protein